MFKLSSEYLPVGNRVYYQMAIVLDGRLISAARILTPIGDTGRITGFDQQEVDDLVRILNIKEALPCGLTRIGQASINVAD